MEVPVLNWFESNPWAKVGNMYTGSVGVTSIHNNAFLYRINYFRPKEDEGEPYLVAEAYNTILESEGDADKYLKETFPGTQEGRTQMIEWLEKCYAEHISSGAANKVIKFSSQN